VKTASSDHSPAASIGRHEAENPDPPSAKQKVTNLNDCYIISTVCVQTTGLS
jgi:hypothetical protein